MTHDSVIPTVSHKCNVPNFKNTSQKKINLFCLFFVANNELWFGQLKKYPVSAPLRENCK